MKCKLCEQFYKDYPLQKDIDKEHQFHELKYSISSPIRCAFEKGMFSTDNWSCQTMVRLRELCGEGEGTSNVKLYAYYMRYEDESIGVLPVFDIVGFGSEKGNQEGFLVMTWYKGRGKTSQAYIWCDTLKPEILTLRTAEAIVMRYKEK